MTLPVSQSDWIGTVVLKRYRVVQVLAVGGMGAVYLGRADGARGFVRPVVIKRILAEYANDEEAVSMFVREARILSQLHDPGIVSVLDFGQEPDGTLVMVLEYVHGYHLGYWHAFTQSQKRKMDADTASYIVTRVLDALSHAHNFTHPDGRRMQVIHRDISPSNVLLDTHGNVKLVDFGIARTQGDEVQEYKTEAPRLKGKFGYMPLELFRGEEPTVQADVYACGVMLYELLAGANPYRGRTMVEVYDKVCTLTPTPLCSLRDDVSPELDAAVAKGMAQDPAVRFASALEFANALRAARAVPDETLRAALRETLVDAYAGPLPDTLRIEPLSARSEAWRDTGDGTSEPSLETITHRPPPGMDDVSMITDAEPLIVAEEKLGAQGGRSPKSAATQIVAPPTGMLAKTRPPSVSRPWFGLVVGLLVIAAAASAFWAGRRQRGGEDRVVVIERQPGPALGSPPNETSARSAVRQAAPVVEPAVAKPARVIPGPAPASHSRAVAGPPTAPNPHDLTRSFSRQRAKIEGCFSKHPSRLGNETLSIKFQISESGAVQTAELLPKVFAATPLGRCIVEVAKSARFARQREELAFQIPITARRVP